MSSQTPKRATDGSVAAAISDAMVQLLATYTGRGPTKARTTIGSDHVLVILRDTLTKGERTLAQNGYADEVLSSRKRFHSVMGPEAINMVEGLTDRKVIGFMSDNHIDPDLGVEFFMLESDGAPLKLAEADSA